MIRRIVYLSLISFIFSACRPTEKNQIPVGRNYFEIDNQFQELYRILGGQAVLGPVISPKFSHQDSKYQYTAAALFVYNPLSQTGIQTKFASIGLELGIADYVPPGKVPNQELTIYPGFQAYYNFLGGEGVVGSPITNVQYNNEKGRLEQHFENLGFYQLDSDILGEVRLLHYGAWMCASHCDFSPSQNSVVSLYKSTVEPFIEVINRLDSKFLGRPITKPYIAPDGKIQQIFHNVVLVSATNNSGEFDLRPIPEMLGIPAESGIIHAIPEHFQKYIHENIGSELVGAAITTYTQQSQDVFRQCFRKLCLNYFPNKPQSEQIAPVALGYLYRQRFYQESESFSPEIVPEIQTYSITVWEDAPIVQPDTPQIVGVSITKDGVPISDVDVFLLLKLPENITIKYFFPKTHENGTVSLTLNPIDAPHGTVISYDLCVDSSYDEVICTSESFLVWGNP